MRVIANNYTRHIIKGTDVHSQSAQKVPGLVLPFHFRRTKLPPRGVTEPNIALDNTTGMTSAPCVVDAQHIAENGERIPRYCMFTCWVLPLYRKRSLIQGVPLDNNTSVK